MYCYANRSDGQLDMFEPDGGYSCMSLYHGFVNEVKLSNGEWL